MKTFMISLKIFLFFTVLTGIIYPLAVTGIAGILFPEKAAGSIIYRNNIPVGSSLISQNSDTSVYFSSRPSSVNYNPLPSGGSNLSITNSKLKALVKERTEHFIMFNHCDSTASIPPEMVFASASGLDPHISLRAALFQADLVASARHFAERQKQEVYELVNKHLEPPQLGFLGEPRINVLMLNIDLDTIR